MDKERSLAEILKEFETIASLGYREIASFLPKDQIPMGFFCPYVPEELIHASGGFPLRLMGDPPSRCLMSRLTSLSTAAIW